MKILIVDDEVEVCVRLKKIITDKYLDSDVICFSDSKVFMNNIGNHINADLIFLDIKIPEIDGVELGTYISANLPDAKIIFISGYPDMVYSPFLHLLPFGFIDKPLSEEKVYLYIDKYLLNENEDVEISGKSTSIKVRKKSIYYLESEKKVVHLRTSAGEINLTAHLNDIEQCLPDGFIRTHQSFIINLLYATDFSGDSIKMLTGESIPVSRKYKSKAFTAYYSFKGVSK